eukprot:3311872-Prorocentrum_lima.AAC.1
MTSSLVGSEMCIRDRLCDRARRPQQREAAPWRDLLQPCARLITLYAVSYTHLTLPTICSV